MHADGTHLRRLTKTSDGREFDATFSPDSKKIAYERGAITSDYDIRVMTARGKHDVVLLDGPNNDYVSDWGRRP